MREHALAYRHSELTNEQLHNCCLQSPAIKTHVLDEIQEGKLFCVCDKGSTMQTSTQSQVGQAQDKTPYFSIHLNHPEVKLQQLIHILCL